MTRIKVDRHNYVLDIMKYIAANFVIFIHLPFPGIFGSVIKSIARFSVPFFFIISGFYYCELCI